VPKDYEAIKESLRKQHPNYSEDQLKEHAARITNAKRAAAGKPAARFHVKKKKPAKP